jgi:hypothetical protein
MASEEIKAREDAEVFNILTFICLGHERDIFYDDDFYRCAKCGMTFSLTSSRILNNVDNMCPETIVTMTMEE